MARRSELVGVVKPEVDDAAMGQAAGEIEQSMDESSRLTPSVDTTKLKRQLQRAVPGGGLLGGIGSGSRSSGGGGGSVAGAADESILAAQLEKLDDIHEELEKMGVSGGVGGGGKAGGGGGGGLLSSLGLLGLGSKLGGGGGILSTIGGMLGGRGAMMTAGRLGGRFLGPIGMMLGTRQLGKHLGGDVPSVSSAFEGDNLLERAGSLGNFITRGSGVPAIFERGHEMLGESLGNFGIEQPEWMSNIGQQFDAFGDIASPDWLSNLDLSIPEAPGWLSDLNLDIPEAPGWLPDMDLSLPDAPNWLPDLDISAPDTPEWLTNIDQTFSNIQAPGWVTRLFNISPNLNPLNQGQDQGSNGQVSGGGNPSIGGDHPDDIGGGDATKTNKAAEGKGDTNVEARVQNSVEATVDMSNMRDLQEFLRDPERYIQNALNFPTDSRRI